MKTTKQKPTAKARKPSDIMRLYSAVQEYVDSRGGATFVISGAGFHAMTPNKFLVCVEMIGRPPVFGIPQKKAKK